MSSVQARDWDEVHHSEHYGKKGDDVEEAVPVPFLREYLAYGYEAAYGFVGPRGRRKHHLEVTQVAGNRTSGEFQSGRYAAECIVMLPFDRRQAQRNAQLAQRIHLQRQLHHLTIP